MAQAEFTPRLLGFLCNWCGYAAADGAGVSRLQYPPNLRVIRVMCSGRVDPAFLLDGFLQGYDAVWVGGWHPKDCHYQSGNYEALNTVNLWKKLVEEVGINPQRLQMGLVSSAEGIRFAQIVTDLTAQITDLGPLWVGEEAELQKLRTKLKAAKELVPYIKLVQNFKIRLPSEHEPADYVEYYSQEQIGRLFHEMIADKLRIGEIVSILKGQYLSVKEIADTLVLSPSEVSKYLNTGAREGLLWFDEGRKAYTAVSMAGQARS